ncbi:MAG: nucleic acid-binding protein [Methanocalculus sp. MSAO_Arc1]|uniref:RPA family protein n=1 Tax=Methanocalculus TaxID=71151 RepID=UPI000FF20002|nr:MULTISPECIES: nucleic acid-binding protein [unclassified Methanocalculus]MCP1661564.1 RPA family protein [Methanocalculus sp. AMF5]RQD82029.1 MAG: nucleic acid-binding protein [Methanocalculus sp. MSAO_Arc1]
MNNPGRYAGYVREPAKRVFAAELRDARYSFREGEDEKSPTYILLPTGERANRIFVIGSLTQKEKKGEQHSMYLARIADPTGTFFVSAGSYQPEAMQQVAKVEPPAFVAVVGKPNAYETPDGKVLISVRAETVTVVDRDVRDIWVLDAAEATLGRIDSFETAPDAEMARREYNPNLESYKKMVYDALVAIRS